MFRALCHALYCTKMTSWRQMPRVYVHYFAHSPPGTCRAEAHPDADDRVRAATTSEIEGPLRLLKPRRSSASYWFNQATCHHKKSGKVQRYVADVRRREHIVERPAGSIYGQRLDARLQQEQSHDDHAQPGKQASARHATGPSTATRQKTMLRTRSIKWAP